MLKAIQEGKPVWIAEGEKDVDALCESGVTATCNAGGAGKWTSHHAKHLSGADVVITRDEDKAGVRHQEIVAHSLEEVAKSVRLVAPAAGNDATDHLAAGFSVDDFVPVDVGGHEQGLNEENANRHSQGFGSAAKSATMSGSPDSWYESRPAGLFHVRERAGRDGEVEVTSTLLSNFTAQIVASTEIDDGAEVERRLDIEATVAGRKRTASIPASEFTRMDWVIPKLGPDAIIQAGARIKDHARAAIQAVSEPAEVRVMRQTGWRQVDGQWLYLHSSGAIGANGPVDDIEVNLPRTLAKYTLPEPGGTDAVRASLDMLDVAPDRIMLPLLAAVVRAPLGGVDMAIALTGQTGIGKSELAALAQQHYGPQMDARSLPASWSSTANSLEEQGFLTADALLTVDDFVTAGSSRDADRLHATADRLIRGAGNGSGRGRMEKDGNLRAARPTRGMVLVTGEEVPRGQSLRARMMLLNVRRGDVDWQALSIAQQHAAEGTFAAALSTYVGWLAPRLDVVCDRRNADIATLRGKVSSQHRRTATSIASLAWGWKTWLEFAVQNGSITDAQHDGYWERGWEALLAAAEAADAAVGETDPARRFVTLLGSAMASGRAHVASRDGGYPSNEPGAWGWRSHNGVMIEMGHRVGWTDGDNLWLNPDASYEAARTAGDGLTLSAEELRSRLADAGLLQSTDPKGRSTTVRVRLEGGQRRVLHMRAASLDECDSGAVSPLSRAVSPRDSTRQHCDTTLSRNESTSELGKQPQDEGESAESARSVHVTDTFHDPWRSEGLEEAEAGSERSYAPAHGGSAVTGGSPSSSLMEVGQ
ncbi:DUF927 domain-containing protein [Brevibacterium aurantiacum]|uniref:DUF927 domain-containing protein n=1 Tax=Brevibacterium aurantiacum TaxID=273384 RepID=UPI0015E0AE9C|nr:DUF927 domain-containing protein [Brevibacterium aurantiacum]